MKKNNKLTVEQDYNFQLIGITTQENDYRLSWGINQQFNLKLLPAENHSIYNSAYNQHQLFSHYFYMDNKSLSQYHLIANKGDNCILIDELKNIDFFLIIKENQIKDFRIELTRKLKEINLPITTFDIDPAKLKSKEKLLL